LNRRWSIRVLVALTSSCVAAGLSGGFVASVVGAPPAGAQQSLVDSDPAVVQARAELEQAQAAAHASAARLEQVTEQRAAVEAQIADHQTRVTEMDQQRATLAGWRDVLLQRLRARAVALYVAGTDGTGMADILSGTALDGVRRKQLGDAAARTDTASAKKLEDARTKLANLQDQLRTEQADLQQQQVQLDALVTQVQQQQALVDQQVAAANAALERARVIGALHAAGEPIMGPAALTADQMVGWFDSVGYSPHLSNTTVAELVQLYLQEGADENVRGDFAFAQAIVETGGFSASPDNNYSGLGWCDSCARGTVFPTPRDGIRAQIQLLLNYADPNSRAANLHHPPSPYWWDPDPTRAAKYFDTYFAKGWAPTWSDMGHGNWATDPNYSSKVIGVYHRMVAWAQSH
jgi:hypothetical protein